MVLPRPYNHGIELFRPTRGALVDRFERCDSGISIIDLLVEPAGREVLSERTREPSKVDLGVAGARRNYAAEDLVKWEQSLREAWDFSFLENASSLKGADRK